MNFQEAATKNIEDILKELKSSLEGFSEKETKEKIKIFGKNSLKLKERTVLKIITRQIKNPFSYILFLSSLISFFIGEKIDAILIIVFVLINIIFKFFSRI